MKRKQLKEDEKDNGRIDENNRLKDVKMNKECSTVSSPYFE